MATASIENDDTQQVEAAGEGEAVSDREYTEVEQLAMEMGWKPDAKPKNGEFRSAQDWIRSTDRNNKNMKREIEGLKASVERIVDATDKQVKREVEAQAREIEARFAEAVEAKDAAGAAQAAKDMRALEAEQQGKRKDTGDVEADFARANPWYGKDEDATAYAISISQREAARGVTDPKQQLDAVVAAVRKRFPEHFEAEQREQPKTLTLNAPGRPAATGKRGTGFADMPEIARRAADRTYEAMKMRNGDKAPDRKSFDAQYAKDYFADQAA